MCARAVTESHLAGGAVRTHTGTAEVALTAALAVAARSPDRAGRAVARALGFLAHTPQHKMLGDWLLEYLAPGTPGAEYARRLAHQLHPRVRRAFLAGFMLNILFRDPSVSDELKRTHGINAPSLLAISPSMRCNLRCAGCYAGNYARKDDMSARLFDRIISEAEEMGTRFFVIIGGEPFIWEPLLDVIAQHGGSAFQIYTNATLLDDATVERIVRLGNIAPAVSIEGFREQTDARRGHGLYDTALDAMERLRDAGAMFSFSVTATRHNLDDVTSDEFVDLMIEKGALYGWYFTYMPVGLGPDLELMCTPAQRERLRTEVNRIRREKPILAADFMSDGPITGGCLAAGRKYVHINNRGDVEPCVFAHFAVDNVAHKPLVETLKSDFFLELRKHQPFGKNLLRPCPLVDHPGVMRQAVERFGAHPTHPGAESIVSTLQPGLREYADGLRTVSEPAWAKEYRWVEDWLAGDREWQRRRGAGVDAEQEWDGAGLR